MYIETPESNTGGWLVNTRKRNTSRLIPYPEKLDTPEARGQALRHWLSKHNVTVDAFEVESGLGRMTLYKYFKGELDLLNMHQQNVTRLLNAMNMSDWDAYAFFNIPLENRSTNWRTVRPYPMGHGEEEAFEIVSVELDVPLQGVVTVHQTAGFGLVLERHRNGAILVYRAGEVLYSVVSGTPVPEDWTLLGSFHSLLVISSKPQAQQQSVPPLFAQKPHH